MCCDGMLATDVRSDPAVTNLVGYPFNLKSYTRELCGRRRYGVHHIPMQYLMFCVRSATPPYSTLVFNEYHTGDIDNVIFGALANDGSCLWVNMSNGNLYKTGISMCSDDNLGDDLREISYVEHLHHDAQVLGLYWILPVSNRIIHVTMAEVLTADFSQVFCESQGFPLKSK